MIHSARDGCPSLSDWGAEERQRPALLLPSFWRTTLILEPVAGDRFCSPLRPEVKIEFHRDAADAVNELVVAGYKPIAAARAAC